MDVLCKQHVFTRYVNAFIRDDVLKVMKVIRDKYQFLSKESIEWMKKYMLLKNMSE